MAACDCLQVLDIGTPPIENSNNSQIILDHKLFVVQSKCCAIPVNLEQSAGKAVLSSTMIPQRSWKRPSFQLPIV